MQSTTSTALTSRERVARMFERRDHDRVPRFDQMWRETHERWRKEGMTGVPAQLFDFDIGFVGYLMPAPFPGQQIVTHEDAETRVFINPYGETVRYFKNRTGTPEHIGAGCSTPDIWRRDFKPRMTIRHAPAPTEMLRPAYREGLENERFNCLCGRHSLMTAQSLLGTEGLFTAMAAEPEWVKEIGETFTDLLLAWYEAILADGIKPDAIWSFDDLAYTAAPFMSVAMYRELFWPQHKRTADWTHAHGMKFILHTDGDVRSFMDPFIEAGIDCLQPLEAKARMDIRELCPKYGRKLAFFGNIDMTVAITNDRAKVEEEVRSKLAAGMAGNGYIYHSDHSVPPQVSWETYQFIMELLERYGNYR